MNIKHRSPPTIRPSASVSGDYVIEDYLYELLSPSGSHDVVAPRPYAPIPCQSFEAAGIRLAVPTALLDGEISARITLWPAMVRPPDWFIGVGKYRGKHLAVVDLARLVAVKNDRAMTPARQEVAGTFLLIHAVPVALYPQRLLGPVLLDPVHICWRSKRTRRFWLLGVCMRSPVCALLDLAALAATAIRIAGMDCASYYFKRETPK